MKKNLIFVWELTLFSSCGKNSMESNSVSSRPLLPLVPDNRGLLHNDIVLPTNWPPVRSYTNDLRDDMDPFYFEYKPDKINVSVGRQIFVDDFLIQNSTLSRKFYYPKYYSCNPVLLLDKKWEKLLHQGQHFAAPFNDGVWYVEMEQKFKMWNYAGAIFSFWISPTVDGKSSGYTGGGGPRLDPTGINKK